EDRVRLDGRLPPVADRDEARPREDLARLRPAERREDGALDLDEREVAAAALLAGPDDAADLPRAVAVGARHREDDAAALDAVRRREEVAVDGDRDGGPDRLRAELD